MTFALQCSETLHQELKGLGCVRSVRELREELETLDIILESLLDAATSNVDGFTILNLPVHRCGQACKEFGALVAKLTTHSTGTRTSWRDRTQLKYMGDDIDGFKNMLVGYKCTITIELFSANI